MSEKDTIAKECGWTPVSEGLPEKEWANCFVLVPEMSGHYVTVEADFYCGRFYRETIINHNRRNTSTLSLDVHYWMERASVPEYKDE